MSFAIAYKTKKSKGGRVPYGKDVKNSTKERYLESKGVHKPMWGFTQPFRREEGNSWAGEGLRSVAGFDPKPKHREVLAELRSMKGPHGNYAHGGQLTHDGYQSMCDEHCNDPCEVHMSDAEGYAEGGNVNSGKNRVNFERGVHKSYMPLANEHGESIAGNQWREGDKTSRYLSKEKHSKRLHELRSMPSPKLKACGGMVDRVMAKRMAGGGELKGVHVASGSAQKEGVGHMGHPSRQTEYSRAGHATREHAKYGGEHNLRRAKFQHEKVLEELRSMKGPHGNYSEGGRVANEDEITAGFEPNEFDDLHLRDDLDFEYTGANSGDELGDEGEDERRRDIVSRIMRSRAKRAGHNPRPA